MKMLLLVLMLSLGADAQETEEADEFASAVVKYRPMTWEERNVYWIDYNKNGNNCEVDTDCPTSARCMGYIPKATFGQCKCAKLSGCGDKSQIKEIRVTTD